MSDCRILSDLLFKIKDIKLFFSPRIPPLYWKSIYLKIVIG
jgi:hypothetical protein